MRSVGIGADLDAQDLVKNEHIPKLFTPIRIRNNEFKNRIFVVYRVLVPLGGDPAD